MTQQTSNPSTTCLVILPLVVLRVFINSNWPIAAAISDDEDERSDAMSDEEHLPPKKPATKKAAVRPKPEPKEEADDRENDQVKNEADDDDDDEEDGADEYVVEKILKHAFDDGKDCLYEVKWLGYENAEDRTWEPEANL
jgi:chromobox protein 1